MSGYESRVILFAPNPSPRSPIFLLQSTGHSLAPNPSPQVALFLAHPRKRAEKEGSFDYAVLEHRSAQDRLCSNAAEAGSAEAEV